MSSSAAEVERLLQAARLHLAQGELHDAVGRATEAIRLDGKEPAAYLVRAEAHRRLNRPDRAVADLSVAIRLDSNQPSPYVIRAQILTKRCLFDQAIADATNAIILDARSAAAYSIRAECRSAIGDKEGATEDVHEMLRIDPTRPLPDLRARSVSGDPSLRWRRMMNGSGSSRGKRPRTTSERCSQTGSRWIRPTGHAGWSAMTTPRKRWESPAATSQRRSASLSPEFMRGKRDHRSQSS
jgi:tetratricopeptide (TPR) repeat protein